MAGDRVHHPMLSGTGFVSSRYLPEAYDLGR